MRLHAFNPIPERLGLTGEGRVLRVLGLSGKTSELAQQLLLPGGELGRGLDEQLDH
jgi:hypothetical protein